MEKENRRKKILLVTRPIAPPWDEASKNFAYNLAKNTGGFDFYLLTNGIIPDLPENIHQKPIYTSNNFSYLQKLRLLKHLRKMRNDFDVLHYIFTPTKQNTFLIKKLAGSKKAKSIQTVATLREDLFSDKEIKGLIFGDSIVTYSDCAKNKLNKLGFSNVQRIYPGIDLNLYSPAPKDNQLLTTLNLQPGDFILTYPGEFTRLGATDDIVDMIIRHYGLLDKNKIKIIFACRIKNKNDLRKKEEVQKKLRDKNLLGLARFPETFTTLEKLFNTSDLVIFPVRDMKGKFDVPLAVVEAMACVKPVIISDLPILQEFANETNSVTIKSGDTGKLFSAIIDLYQNKEKREKIGKNAREYVEKNFDIQKIAEQYKKIYEEL
ncbi:MAG: glycosyltransferase family 4 protein [Candidatus Moranbacteria bacterium]|nr:glycosyltransferase family 4 protein [Candidatus Moranbacteria bacterium]